MDKVITVRIPDKIIKTINRLSLKKGVTRSIYIRNAIREAIRQEKLEVKK